MADYGFNTEGNVHGELCQDPYVPRPYPEPSNPYSSRSVQCVHCPRPCPVPGPCGPCSGP